MGDSRDILDELESTLKQVEADLKKSLIEYQAVCKERDQLVTMFKTISKHVLPGEIDSVDAMALIIKERDEYRKTIKLQGEEVERLKAELERANIWHANWKAANDEINELRNKLRSLEKIAESFRRLLEHAVDAWFEPNLKDGPKYFDRMDRVMDKARKALAEGSSGE